MNNASFKRKLTYIIAIVALLVPVYFLGQPMVQKKEGQGQGGGTLAKIRQKYGIGQADIGEIDPASESARLATLGFRGFATTIAQYKADYYKLCLFGIAILQHSIKLHCYSPTSSTFGTTRHIT
ncbi:MAG: hypothetical protein U0905_11595 [Pirellulales bacterium]